MWQTANNVIVYLGVRVSALHFSLLNTISIFFPQYYFSKDYIIDVCSVERNHILVKTYLVGGASERIIPGRTLTEVTKKDL